MKIFFENLVFFPPFLSEQVIGAAVCSRIFVKSNDKSELEFSLVWDMPKIHFHCKMREYLRWEKFYKNSTLYLKEYLKFNLLLN